MVDVSGVEDVMPGDEGVMIGRRGELSIGADELAEKCHTIPYEILLLPGRRVPHLYSDDGKI